MIINALIVCGLPSKRVVPLAIIYGGARAVRASNLTAWIAFSAKFIKKEWINKGLCHKYQRSIYGLCLLHLINKIFNNSKVWGYLAKSKLIMHGYVIRPICTIFMSHCIFRILPHVIMLCPTLLTRLSYLFYTANF